MPTLAVYNSNWACAHSTTQSRRSKSNSTTSARAVAHRHAQHSAAAWRARGANICARSCVREASAALLTTERAALGCRLSAESVKIAFRMNKSAPERRREPHVFSRTRPAAAAAATRRTRARARVHARATIASHDSARTQLARDVTTARAHASPSSAPPRTAVAIAHTSTSTSPSTSAFLVPALAVLSQQLEYKCTTRVLVADNSRKT